MRKWLLGLFLISLTYSCVLGQPLDKVLIPKMENFESDIQNTYREYQKIYYEKKSSLAELNAFENIISIYVAQILEIHETLFLSGFSELEEPRNIAARSLIYRALIYLEKAPLNLEYYEKACYDYYRALAMFNNVDTIPAIFKKLPNPILVGAKQFSRLIDVIDHKGSELYAFGKVDLNLRNFKITTNLDIDDLEFVRVEAPADKKKYTYYSAEKRIKDTFKSVLTNDGQSSTFLALPEGSYFIRPKTHQKNSKLIALSALYVRANQQHNYIVEPLVDWFIMYEIPNTKKPKFSKAVIAHNSSVRGNGDDSKKDKPSNYFDKNESMEKLIMVSELANTCLEQVDSDLIFNIKDPWIRSKFANTAAEVICKHVETLNYHNCWSKWMLSWIIAKEITQRFSPDTEVPTELIKLVYHCLKKIQGK